MANNQEQGQRGGGQTLEQQRQQANQQGGRLQTDPQAAQQRSGGQGQQSGNTGVAGQQGSQQGQQASQDQAQQARRASFDEHKRSVQERPQQVGSPDQQPTPTQQENDEIRAGLRHVDDKEDDRSGADFVHTRVVRRADEDAGGQRRQVEADQSRGKYETR